MIGIQGIGSYIPNTYVETNSLLDKFNVTKEFITEKTGFLKLARKAKDENIVDMCVKAYEEYCVQNPAVSDIDFDFICLCTQTPETTLPHLSAKLQSRLGLSQHSASFDISIGCSGYAYGLAIAIAFMEKTGLKNGLFFTCDPYSPHIADDDKNMQLLFGDAATVTHLSHSPLFAVGDFAFETFGEQANVLALADNGFIHMDGRAIFNFAVRPVVKHLQAIQEKNEEQDIYLLHQASYFMIDMVRKSAQLPTEKVPFMATYYGNTVSSSIPLLLKECIHSDNCNNIAICGFGVGLSISSALLKRILS